MLTQEQLTLHLQTLLATEPVLIDACPNGLQFCAGPSRSITKVALGVTASLRFLSKAREWGADACLVHHGLFWKGDSQVISGMLKARLKVLFEANMSLYAYHLPLDVHPTLGNNAQLAESLGIRVTGQSESGLLWYGELSQKTSLQGFATHAKEQLATVPLVIEGGDSPASDASVQTVGWCTGAGQSYIHSAANLGLDCFITGEASEQTTHSAREMGIHFVRLGHHATEKGGVKALGQHLARECGLQATYLDDDNPV